MEIIDGVMCPCLKDDSSIYVHCIEMDNTVTSKISNLLAVRFNLVFAHISFPENLDQRRFVLLLATDDVDELCQLPSPVIIEVTSSCYHQVDLGPRSKEMAVICGFNVMQNQIGTVRAVPPKLSTSYDKSGSKVPFLPSSAALECNCANFGNKSVIGIWSSKEDKPGAQKKSVPPPQGGQKPEQDLKLFSDSFKLKGVSFHVEFQDTINRCRADLASNQPLRVRLRHEPDNGQDKNAIVTESFQQGHWKPIGYIPGPRVPKMHAAIYHEEITSIILEYTVRHYNEAIQKFLQIPYIIVTKHGKWLANENDYHYNQHINFD